MSFFQRRKINKVIKKLVGSPLYEKLSNHKKYFFKEPMIAQLSQEKKDITTANMNNEIFNIYNADNPRIFMRGRLAEYVISFAEYRVLCLTEEQKPLQDFSDSPYISAELYKSIDKIVEYYEEIQNLKLENPDISDEELFGFCYLSSLIFYYYIGGINHLREAINDYDDERDWLQPFIKVMLISQENRVREKIGLQSLFPKSDKLAPLEYGLFLDLVINGNENPYYEWEKRYNRKLE